MQKFFAADHANPKNEDHLIRGVKVESTTKLAGSPAERVALANEPPGGPQAIPPDDSPNNLKAEFRPPGSEDVN